MQQLIPLIAVIALLIAGTVAARRRGYKIGGDVIARCRDGHLFTTIWIPGASFKAIRLGLVRLQYCPVGHHLTFVVPVRDEDLTAEERRIAAAHHDARLP